MIREVNDARAQNGLGALKANRRLTRAADVAHRDMIRSDFFDHTSSDGTPFDSRVRRYARVGLVGETLARVPGSAGAASRIVQMWLELRAAPGDHAARRLQEDRHRQAHGVDRRGP